jgi:MFS family permease
MGRQNRWLVLVAGTLVMLLLGTVYAWSNFTQPLLASFGWSNTVTTWTFAIAVFFIGIGAVAGGRWQDRVGPRTVTIAGVVLWGIGNLLAGLGTQALGAPWIYLTYGVIGGFGTGMAYITPVATVTKWFPERRGFASGAVVMGFGLGAFFYGFILKAIPSFAHAAKNASAYADARAAATKAGAAFAAEQYRLGAADVSAIMNVFIVSGIVFLVAGGACAWFLSNPPPGYAVAGSSPAARAAAGIDYTTAEMLKTPQFYYLWLMLFLNVTAGILIVSNAVPIIRELTGAAAGTAIAGYASVAMFNGLGRFFWGAVSDRLGRNTAYILIYAVQVAVFLGLASLGSIGPVLAAFAVILACYGGGFGVMPSFNADFFGTKYMGANYGLIITAWGFAGLAGPLLVARVKDATGSFGGALMPVAVMLALAIVLPFITKRPNAELTTAMQA